MATLPSVLATTARRVPQHPALKWGDSSLTYADLDATVDRLAGELISRGLRPGDRVVLVAGNTPEFVIGLYGALRAGAIVAPVNPRSARPELEHFLADTEARMLLVDPTVGEGVQALAAADSGSAQLLALGALDGFDDVLAAADGRPEGAVAHPDLAEDDDALIIYTSGTTGRPKGAQLTHDNLNLNAQRSAEDIIGIQPDDVIMGCLPLFHVFGLTCGLNAAVRQGATLTLIPRFDPGKALEVIARDTVTIFEGVPTMYGAMLHHPAVSETDTSSLRTCVSGGSSLPGETLREFEETFKVSLLEGYGLSETSPVASFNMLDQPTKPGTIGRAIPGCEMKLIGEDGQTVGPGEGVGEIAIRGDNVMKGYWGKPESTEAAIPDGWFRTGDIASVDEDGYYTIVDRKKDLIIRGGMNIYPREIEEVLYTHPDVLECAVVSVPHPELGEDVGAAVSLREGASGDLEEIKQYVKDRVAAYKYPRTIWVLDELPKGPTGKILKREIHAPTA